MQKKKITLQLVVFTTLALVLAMAVLSCNNYNLLDQFEDPAGTQKGPLGPQGPLGPPRTYRIFVTAGSFTGSLDGFTGADAKCNADANRPPELPSNSNSYKALLVGGTTRRACNTANCGTGGISENADWVLKPNTQYIGYDQGNPKGPLFMTNDAGVFVFTADLFYPLAGAGNSWTGLEATWEPTTDNCSMWISSMTSANGYYGNNTAIDSSFISSTLSDCSSLNHLYCVEQ